MPRACVQLLGWRAQINHQAGFAQAPSVLRVQHHAAAGGQHQPRFSRQFLQHPGLAAAKARLALDLENQRNARPGARLDFMVAVDEALLQAPRQVPADRGLARANHAHEIDVVAGFHAVILSGGNRSRKKEGPASRPRDALPGAQRRLRDSLMIFGVMKTSSSVLLSFRSLFLKRKPT